MSAECSDNTLEKFNNTNWNVFYVNIRQHFRSAVLEKSETSSLAAILGPNQLYGSVQRVILEYTRDNLILCCLVEINMEPNLFIAFISF